MHSPKRTPGATGGAAPRWKRNISDGGAGAGMPPWPAALFQSQPPPPQATPPSSRTSGGRKRAATPQRSSDHGYGGGGEPSGPNLKVCANCGTSNTPLWRKEAGQHMCNACGIYYKNHGYHRSMDLAKAPSRTTGSHPRCQGVSHAGSVAGGGGRHTGLSCEVGGGYGHEDTATSPLARNAK